MLRNKFLVILTIPLQKVAEIAILQFENIIAVNDMKGACNFCSIYYLDLENGLAAWGRGNSKVAIHNLGQLNYV